jgi:hypothetical protein
LLKVRLKVKTLDSLLKDDAILGIPIGQARAKLWKNVFFKLVCDLEQNVCFQCGNEIKKLREIFSLWKLSAVIF